ncbi:hypothetical protein [Gelatiniphilus marinus]|uniref:DUF4139 domain-containing protein n=1 Tax=Gelatiniphilus marinus TaxID=1759464 RepID=A0ABW5JTH9_9FLAO
MKAKWSIGALIIILSLFGALTQQQVPLANQEIVLQFTDASITAKASQNTIAIVKRQLQDLGVSNIQIKEKESRKLIITYYSDTDIESIKATFSKEKNITLDYAFSHQNKNSSNLPFDENTVSYNLDIYEIQNGSGAEWDLNGISVIEPKQDTNRLSKPNSYAFFNTVNINHKVKKNTGKIHGNVAIALHSTSYKIPQVRAGPMV